MSHIPPLPRRGADQVVRGALLHFPLVTDTRPRHLAAHVPAPAVPDSFAAVLLGSLGFALTMLGMIWLFFVLFGA